MPRVTFRNRVDTDSTIAPIEILVPVGPATITGRTPTVVAPAGVAVPAGALTFTGRVPTLAIDGGGGGGDLFTMDVSSGAAPLAGFDEIAGAAEEDVVVNTTRETGIGPGGEAAYLFEFLYDASQMNAGASYGGEHYLGWKVGTTVPSLGQTRYGRIRFRVSSDSDFEAVDSGDGSASQIIHKLVIQADGGTDRVIVSVHGDVASGTFELQCGRNGGGENKAPGLLRNTWYNVQWATLFGLAGAGSLKLWVNNNTFASPTAETTGLTFSTGSHDVFNVGYYNNRMRASAGTYKVHIRSAEYATSFDSGWHV